MHIAKAGWIFVLLLSFWVPLQAATDSSTSSNRSVYLVRPWVDGPLLLLASGGAAVPLFFEKSLVHKTDPGNPDDVNRIDRNVIGNRSDLAAWTSHLTVTMAIGMPILLDYKDLGWSQEFREDFIVYAEVLAINSSINNLARYSVQRPRPEAYGQNPPPTDPGSYLSFHAGHVSSTVAALSAASMTYGYRYGHRAWPWVVTGLVGVAQGYMRSAAGKHFYSDDLVGIMVGTSVGTLVPMMHHRRGASASAVTLVPVHKGAELVWQRKF